MACAVKPAPDMVLHLCRAVGVPPTRTAVVGDSPADLRMARAAGAGLAIGVLTGVGGRADLEPLADVVARLGRAAAGRVVRADDRRSRVGSVAAVAGMPSPIGLVPMGYRREHGRPVPWFDIPPSDVG